MWHNLANFRHIFSKKSPFYAVLWTFFPPKKSKRTKRTKRARATRVLGGKNAKCAASASQRQNDAFPILVGVLSNVW